MRNSFFENMHETEREYRDKERAALEQRARLLKGGKYNEGISYMEKFKKENPYPFNNGEAMALQAYERMCKHDADHFEVEELPISEYMEEFVRTLRNAGISSIVVTDISFNLMDGIHALVGSGCTIGSPEIVNRKSTKYFKLNKPERRKGLEFQIW